MKKKNLQSLLENLLNEDVPQPQPKNMQDFSPSETPIDVSLDQAVDRYIIRYEKESIPTSTTYQKQISNLDTANVNNSIEKLLERLLNEADEETPGDDPAKEDAPDAGGLDLGGGTTEQSSDTPIGGADTAGAGTETEPGQQPVMATPQINLQDFARSIARLVSNYEALLNPREIIINRVKEYIKTNYDVRTAEELSELLSKNYNITTAKDIADQEEDWPTSYSVGALSSEG